MPLYPEVLRTKERASTPYFSVVFALDLHLSLSRSLGVHHMVFELWYNSIHLLGSFDGTKEDP
jgi:hypothetical protein